MAFSLFSSFSYNEDFRPLIFVSKEGVWKYSLERLLLQKEKLGISVSLSALYPSCTDFYAYACGCQVVSPTGNVNMAGA